MADAFRPTCCYPITISGGNSESMNGSNPANIDLEAKLIEQEHRLLRVLLNVLFETKSLPASDPRKIAARKALLWQLVPTGGQSTALLGTIIAVLTVAYAANRLLKFK